MRMQTQNPDFVRCSDLFVLLCSDLFEAMVSKLFNLFTGASADVKVGFDESTRADLIRSIPFVNMTYAQMVSIYRPLVTMYPAMLRGTDTALQSLNLLLGLECLAARLVLSLNTLLPFRSCPD